MDAGGAELTELSPNLSEEEAMLMLDAHSDTENTCGLVSEGSEHDHEETVDEQFACKLESSQGSPSRGEVRTTALRQRRIFIMRVNE